MSLRVLSCFSGAGGLDLGLEAAGFVNVGCLETDPLARETLRLNRPGWPLLEPCDVVAAGTAITPRTLGMEPRDLTLIAGGPPCQPFSKAAQWSGPKRGVTDERGNTVTGMMQLVGSFLPAAVLIENVSGFLAGANNARDTIEAEFASVNATHGTKYALQSWVVDAASFGTAQRRKRAIAIAFRDGAMPECPPPTHDKPLTAWDALGAEAPSEPPAARGRYADLLPCIPEGDNYLHLTSKGTGPELFGYRTRYWSFLLKLSKHEPAWTLPASPGPSTGPFHWDNRPLTPREVLLLQGFPGEWKLPGPTRVGQRLAGNATPPPLAEVFGRFIVAVLARGDTSRPTTDVIRPTLAAPRRTQPAPDAVPPAPLPARWQPSVGPKARHPGPGSGPGSIGVGRNR
jgi:DNA (cytosine-5)-methyltransferase 1